MIIQKSDVLRWQFLLSAKLVKGPFLPSVGSECLKKAKKNCEITLEDVKSPSKELMVICMIELLRKERRSWCLGSELE